MASKPPSSGALVEKKAAAARGGGAVTGTDADLRRLSMDAAREVSTWSSRYLRNPYSFERPNITIFNFACEVGLANLTLSAMFLFVGSSKVQSSRSCY